MQTTTLKVAQLEVCDRTRVRYQTPKTASDIVQEYADAYRCGLLLHPLDVFREKGTERYIVADGEHRLLALKAAKIEEVDVLLHEGDEIAALDFAIGCNQTHGLRRTKLDRYRAFTRIMETPALRSKYRTDTDLADKVGISIRTVAEYKAQWRDSESGDKRVRATKEKARSKAEKHNGVEHREVAAPTPEPPAKKTKTMTAEQKAIGKEVRESISRAAAPAPAWTTEDQHALALLDSAWNKATLPARAKFMAARALPRADAA